MKKIIALLAVVIAVVGISTLGYKYFVNEKQSAYVDSAVSDIKAKGTLVVGSDIPYGVMEFFDQSGVAVGVDVDIAQEIATSLGVKLEFEDHDFDSLFELLKKGDIDLVVSSITITPERQKEMLFSTPYFNGGQAILVKNTSTIKGERDLTDGKIGVQVDTTANELAAKYTTKESILTYKDPSAMIEAIGKGEVDSLLIDYVAAITIVKDNPSLKITGEPLTQEFYGVVAKLGNDSLVEEVNSTLRGIKRSGKLEQIINTWVK
jgi:ABC-type amino acid transport substrate-binding protein